MTRLEWMLVFTAGLGACLAPGCFHPWRVEDPPSVGKANEEGADSAKRGPGGSSYRPLPRAEEQPNAVVNGVPAEQNDSPAGGQESATGITGNERERSTAESAK